MMTRWYHGQSETFVERAGPEIHGDRADHADRVESGQRLEILGHRENHDGDCDGGDEWQKRHAVWIEPGQLSRHLAVLRHHVDDADQGDDRGIDRAEKEKSEDDADDDAQDLADARSERPSSRSTSARKRNMSSLCAANSGSETSWAMRASPSRGARCPMTTSIATGTIAFVAVRVTFGCSGVESGSVFITPVMFAIASTPLSARMTPTNATQVLPRFSWRGSK